MSEITQHVGTQNITTQNVTTSPPGSDGSTATTNSGLVHLVVVIVGGLLVLLLVVMGLFEMFGETPLNLFGSNGSGIQPDTPPIEYAYLDGVRASAYMGELEGGLTSSVKRTEEVEQSLSATIPVGSAAKFDGSLKTHNSAVTTITPQAASRFYTYLERLRGEGEATFTHLSTCHNGKHWLGEVDDLWSRVKIMEEVTCIGTGNFVRIKNAQLFLPPFAQTLPRLQSTNVFFGALPSPRTPFTSPVQSAQFAKDLRGYTKIVGSHARIPFVAAPYGVGKEIGAEGGGIPIFLPSLYRSVTLEPSLLSGPVTIVGEIVYYANNGGPAYIDYPTVATFGRALLRAGTALRLDLGVCASEPSAAIRAHAPKGMGGSHSSANKRAATVRKPPGASGKPKAKRNPCLSQQKTLYEVKKSVTFKPPFVVVLPLAIYE